MKIRPFELERYFAKYEFSVKYIMSASDCETMTVAELMTMAGDEGMETWSQGTVVKNIDTSLKKWQYIYKKTT